MGSSRRSSSSRRRAQPKAKPPEPTERPEPAERNIETILKHPIVVSVLSGLILAAALFLGSTYLKPLFTPSDRHPFEDPKDHESVASPFIAHGHVDVPDDKRLWLIVQPPDGNYYFAQRKPVDITPSGEWSMTVSLGKKPEDADLSYNLYLVLAPRTGSVFEEIIGQPGSTSHAAGPGSLPADTRTIDRIRVTLVGYHGGSKGTTAPHSPSATITG